MLLQDPQSVDAVAGLAVAIVFAYRLMRSPGEPQRRQPRRQAPTTSSSGVSTQSNTTLMPSGFCSSLEDLRAQNVVDEFVQPVKVFVVSSLGTSYFFILSSYLFVYLFIFVTYNFLYSFAANFEANS